VLLVFFDFLFMIRPYQTPTLFPYTTLFRSHEARNRDLLQPLRTTARGALGVLAHPGLLHLRRGRGSRAGERGAEGIALTAVACGFRRSIRCFGGTSRTGGIVRGLASVRRISTVRRLGGGRLFGAL